jgi:hypothetical protein
VHAKLNKLLPLLASNISIGLCVPTASGCRGSKRLPKSKYWYLNIKSGVSLNLLLILPTSGAPSTRRTEYTSGRGRETIFYLILSNIRRKLLAVPPNGLDTSMTAEGTRSGLLSFWVSGWPRRTWLRDAHISIFHWPNASAKIKGGWVGLERGVGHRARIGGEY